MTWNALLPVSERIQTFVMAENGRDVFIGIANGNRATFFMRFTRAGFGSEKLCGIISTWMDFAATHAEPAGRH